MFASHLHFHFLVTMQPQMKAPPNMHCIDKFLIQSIVAKPGTTTEDITSDMVTKHKQQIVFHSRCVF